jgi:hypothetical protein
MYQIFLDRTKSDENGTFGALHSENDDLGTVFTVERPMTGDHPCIAPGAYTFRKYFSPHMQMDVYLRDECGDGRTAIEIHPANTMNDLRGCIGVGNSLGIVDGLPAVLNSRNTFDMLKSKLPDVFQLTITGDTPWIMD